MQRLCRNGLHEKDYLGDCVECTRARRRRYEKTEKGKARHAKFTRTAKGQEVVRRRNRRYYERMPGLIYQARLLQNRRRDALRRIAKRREQSGALQE